MASRSPSPRINVVHPARQNFKRPSSGEKFSGVHQHPRPPLPPSNRGGGNTHMHNQLSTNTFASCVLEKEFDSAIAGADGCRVLLSREAAARCMQSWYRVWRQRSAYKKERVEQLFSLNLLVKWKKCLLSGAFFLNTSRIFIYFHFFILSLHRRAHKKETSPSLPRVHQKFHLTPPFNIFVCFHFSNLNSCCTCGGGGLFFSLLGTQRCRSPFDCLCAMRAKIGEVAQ